MKKLIVLFSITILLGTVPTGCRESVPDDPEKESPETPGDGSGENHQDDGLTAVYFTELSGAITNPERGFYYPSHYRSSSSPLSLSEVKKQRNQGITLFYIQFRLDQCMSSDIPEDYLSKMQSTFDALRDGGAKCILRYCYKENESESNKPWDAEEKWVMRHIEQVTPLLRKNEDVILLFQAGYVGVWGEWYYTDHFGMNPSSSEDYQPRRRVLDAMLEALPASRQVAVRTPDFKMKMYGLGLSDTLTAETAHSGSIASRIGGYNDCFGASADDYGTYGGSHSRAFWKGDTRYTFMGGETCNLSDYCKCNVSLRDMETYHWTYLNIGYNQNVINRWKKDGCYDEIVNRLGYRLVLDSLKHSPKPVPGEPCKLVFYMRNAGFSAPQNPRDANLVFVGEDGRETSFELGSDPRTWHPGVIRIETSIDLPEESGTLYLCLRDPLLPDRPEYSIALANPGVWDASSGRNKILSFPVPLK